MVHSNGQIIIIDDDLLLCQYLEHELRSTGLQLKCTHSGVAGLKLIREQTPDLVLLDVNLPDIDGFEVCRQMKAEPAMAHIPVVFITASSDAFIAAFQAGAVDCVTKPLRGAELRGRIQRAMQQAFEDGVGEVSDSNPNASIPQSTSSDEERQRLNKAMAEVDHVLGVIGHELRTPLAGLRVMSEYLLTAAASSGTPHEFLQAIHDETIRLSNMVNNFLEAARIKSGNARWSWGEVAVQAVCQSALKLIAPLARKDIRFVCDIQPETMTMNGDADAILRLLLNLLSNAQKHTDKGTISVHARYASDADGEWVEFSVADTGSGIAPELTEKLGVPFAINGGVTRDSVGSGLGISICKTIAAAHGGSLCFDSTPCKGTVVVARLRADLAHPNLSSSIVERCEVAA